ncbi:cytochrome-c oxidase, cbb3-type subunit III [Brevirhabdus pacifica]|uniref:Cbb3-type cytochrome c oxidase subunit n=1 Tax=Brevirhabdus pacifica TaxID=1267768 RepID=A0A1U7DLA7_9RHOB|nr:cytochrome-c oxidase, cbb3-type subunit III [Brevirhabdus pacifica]APX90807.1 cytochrome-c oxidase, cbb3-type subunit III [Brevirhabdus pacifica]OWU79589.1 cytochrome Cbb3 [Loktanella sp. 22II-4b]PJJ87308.1 cytochrome c oxidase cbb3-type subunit 3 [Brevirhabdus pacifica]
MSEKSTGKPDPGTTGHNWDGIEELNNPLPRWWLWTFYATIFWGVIYTLLFPAWPLVSGATSGMLNWSTRGDVAAEIAAADALQAPRLEALAGTDLAALGGDPELESFALHAGGALFRNNCSTCHGSGAAGARGYPNLLDDDWLWGGSIEEIAISIRHGIRNEEDPDARFSQMPAYGEMLSKAEIAAVADHVWRLSRNMPAKAQGKTLFADNCAACHGEDATGNRDEGAPDLTDAIWLYGGTLEEIAHTVTRGPFGVMPAWGERLGEAQVRALAAYVHQLGGGEESPPAN